MENLILDGKFLKPMSSMLESKIQNLMEFVYKKNKTGEITLKLELSTIEVESDSGSWQEPSIKYQITEKVKETKDTRKGHLGQGYKIDTSELIGDIYVQEIKNK